MRTAKLILLLVLAASTGIAPGRSAQAAGSFTFFGSGYGHGVGMSQYGALGMAQDGWTSEQILTRFFTDTTVGPYAFPTSIRVGIVQGVKVYHLHARNGPVELHIGDPDGLLVATIPTDVTWEVRVGSGRYRILDGKKLIGGREWGGPKKDLVATYRDGGGMLQIKEAGGISYNRGRIEFNIYSDVRRGRIIAVLSPQDYLYGLGEVPSSWPMQAMMAQAVASRTYAFEIAERVGQHQSWCNCAVTDDTRNQVYVAWAKEGAADGDRWVAAVDNTDGIAVLYHDNLIQAQFSSSDGGYSEDNENVWNGSPLPYLRGVCDPGDYTSDNPNRVWRKELTASQVTGDLAGATGGVGTVTKFTDVHRGVSGRIVSTVVVGTKGHATISGYELKSGLGLLEDRVWINADRNVVGPIRNKYDNLDCGPRLPTSSQENVAGGQRQRFDNGTIFFKSATGAHWIRDDVLDAYGSHGGPGGSLGFPTSDVQTGDDGHTWATFQNGKITCPADGSACSMS
jgi:stage II sporulation protein D